MAIGVLIPEFPDQTHIMFWREVSTLRDTGETVFLLSTRRPTQENQHPFAANARAETHYLLPPNWMSAVGYVLTHPIGALKGLGYVWGLRESSAAERLRLTGVLACAADLAAFCRRNDIRHVHCHSCAMAAHVVAAAEAMGGPTYSLNLHGDLPVYGKDHVSKMAHAKFVATDGAHLKPAIVEQVGYPEERIVPNMMGVDLRRFDSIGPRSAEAGRIHLATVARLNRCKGHVHGFRAVRRAIDRGVDIRYTVAGDGPHAAEIKAEAERLGLTKQIQFVGSLPEPEVLKVLAEADAFLLPSIGVGEAYPVSIMEAMAAGLPVISSIIGSTPEMIETGVSGYLVEQQDEDGLTEAIVALANDPEARLRMGEAARRHAAELFDVRTTAGRLLSAINA